jgi:hypothetical protein
MAFLLNSQQNRLQAVTTSLVRLVAAGAPAVRDTPAAPDPGLPENTKVSGWL